MRRPELHRTVSIVIVIALAAAIAATFALSDGPVEEGLAVGFVVFALTAVVFAIMYAVHSHLQAGRFRRLMQGEGLIARWTIHPQLWRQFNAATENRASERPDGVEVIVGESAAIVDGSIEYLPLDGIASVIGVRFVDTAAPHLEYEVRTQQKTGSTISFHRVPVGLGARGKALLVVESYRTRMEAIDRRALIERNPPVTRMVASIVAAIAAIACAAGFSLNGNTEQVELAVTLAVSGAIVAPVSLIIAIIAHVGIRRAGPPMPPPARSPRSDSSTSGAMPPPARRPRDLSSSD